MSYALPSRRLVYQEDQSLIERPDVPRSRFTGSWTRKTSFDASVIVPFMLDEVLPGDHLKYDVTAYIRMATPIFPLFDQLRIDTHFFFVPNRLVWINWERFMGAQDTPISSISYNVPRIDSVSGGDSQSGLQDHMGIPVNGQIALGQTISYSALPFRGYNLIWNTWFRDENLQDSAVVYTNDGPDPSGNTDYFLRPRAKSHDYFTSALPWPQKFIAPLVPMNGLAPITGIGINAGARNITTSNVNVYETDNANVVNYAFTNDTSFTDKWFIRATAATNANPFIHANLNAAGVGIAVNDLRRAVMVQTILERDARGGTRYIEILKSHFGVTSPDARLQRPEYIGGGSTPLQITPVAQTAPVEDSPVGDLGAAGTSVGQHRASYASTEHGYIFGLISIKSELSYQQGLHRMFRRQTRYDFYWPSLAQLGEQAVLREELYCTGNDISDQTVFGYQERWHEYRTRYSEVTGRMRSTSTATLDRWHLSQNFGSAPTLGPTFIQDSPPMSRVLAAGELSVYQQFLADILIRRDAVRPLPMYSTPATLGRF